MLTTFAGGRLFGERYGTGAPQALALHGWGGTHAQMSPMLKGIDAISLDLPGFGASPRPDAVWGAREYADCVSSVLDEFAEPAVLLGYSFGGRVAVHLGARFPERVRAIVLTGAPLIRRQASGKAPVVFRLMKKANKFGLVSDARMEAERRKRGSEDYRNATGIMRDVLVRVVNESYENELRSLRSPVDMIWGADDTAAPLAQATLAKDLITAPVTLTVHPGGHFLPLQQPELVSAAVRKWTSQ